MRHNQNGHGRRFRGNNNRGGQGGGNNHSGNRGRINPRVQTFDSNGPDVRIRGNATQINEKYLALAKDAASAGDRVLAESYLQHAEHYQRMINEMTEEYNRLNPQAPLQTQQQGDGHDAGDEAAGDEAVVTDVAMPGAEQPVLDDLDQGFLRKPVRSAPAPAADGEAAEGGETRPARHHRQRQPVEQA